MAIARKVYLFAGALFVFLVASTPALAQGDGENGESDVVCWWCWELQGQHTFAHGGEG